MKTLTGKNKYGTYCVPASSQHTQAASRILRGQVYEPDSIQYMRTHCGTGDIIHAGTYFGDLLPGIAEKCVGMIWAFEPKYENYRCAAETARMNKLTNVSLTHAGLGDHNGTTQLQTHTPEGKVMGGGNRFSLDDNILEEYTETTNIVRLDDVIPKDREISILQLDVEGFEQQALAGAMELIKRCSPTLILETLPTKNWIKENLKSIGYTLTALKLQKNFVLVNN